MKYMAVFLLFVNVYRMHRIYDIMKTVTDGCYAFKDDRIRGRETDAEVYRIVAWRERGREE